MAQPTIFTNKSISHFIVDSPEKAYSLGFLWGDGYLRSIKNANGNISNVHYISLEIVRKDLDSIKHIFNVWGKWNLSYRKRKDRQEQGIITCFDKHFGWFLTVNDYLIKSKVEPSKILSIIPKKLHQYWWRGFIDADGCFYVTKKASQFSIAGAFELDWKETIKMFKIIKINKYQVQNRIHKKSKSSAIRMSNKYEIVKLGNFIYNNNLSIGLKRKYDKYLEVKAKCTP